MIGKGVQHWLGMMLACVACCGLTTGTQAQTLGEKPYVVFGGERAAFPLVSSGHAAPLLVSSEDWPGVVRAVGDLRGDVNRVSGSEPLVLRQIAQARGADAVIIGTIGKSPLINDLVRQHKLDVTGVAGHWEMAVSTVVERPLPGIRRALVIAGADKRGTIYGIYDLSEQIGVSPWYWWADVRVPHHDALFVEPGRHLQPEPAVKYRGIFLNDEAPSLTGWVNEKFGGFNSKFYTHVFELLLREKANYLWPAMWNSAFNEDDPLDPKLADEYGIVMGTSHHEPMLRAQQEWKRHGTGPWDYSTNAAELDRFWREGIERNRNYESTVTLGMRGDGDKPMSETDDVALLEKIVHDQREILAGEATPTLNSDPKIWALYKEVQGYYDKGMRVPDDVTLLWCDDNWGNIRRLPTPAERKRPGGAGIYFHFDYVGGPRSYKWLNTYSITKVWEQMHLALEYGADRVWIVNVGDLKPMEFPIEFFLDYARTPGRWTQDDLHQFTVDWATREFGPEHAEAIAQCVEDYTRLNSLRKPEMMEPTTFSIGNYGEANRISAQWEDLIRRVDALDAVLPADEKASFFELVKYPAEASGNLVLMNIAAGVNGAEARAGRPEANESKAEVERRFALDAALTDEYNHKLLDGKWDHMMDQTHIGYTFWNEPPANAMPPVSEIQVDEHRSLPSALPGKRRNPPLQPEGVPPAGFKGFVEHDGYVSINAADTSAILGTEQNSARLQWVELPGYGEDGGAMTLFPVTATSEPNSAAGLNYSVYLFDQGDFTLHLRLAPTLNFVPGRGLRLAVSVDDGPRTVVDVLEHHAEHDWEIAVGDGVKKVEVPLTISTPGAHMLHLWAVDPGVVLEKLVLVDGELKPSYLGPPESARMNGAAPAASESAAGAALNTP